MKRCLSLRNLWDCRNEWMWKILLFESGVSICRVIIISWHLATLLRRLGFSSYSASQIHDSTATRHPAICGQLRAFFFNAQCPMPSHCSSYHRGTSSFIHNFRMPSLDLSTVLVVERITIHPMPPSCWLHNGCNHLASWPQTLDWYPVKSSGE